MKHWIIRPLTYMTSLKRNKDKDKLSRTIQEFKSMHKLPTGDVKNRNCSIL